MKSPRVALIGCGRVGEKRLKLLPTDSIAVVCDLDIKRAEFLASSASRCRYTDSVEKAISARDVDVVMIATINASLGAITGQAIKAKKHVLVEKPCAISSSEIARIESLAHEHRVLVRVGYNHRYHPAFLKAREIFETGELGAIMFVRARYGHGGRIGYDREWRADQKLSGGGELIDQGVHLIDLAGIFLGEFTTVEGHVATSFWNMAVEDNAFISLRDAQGRTAWLHASCTEWKNTFSFEIYGTKGKLHVEGLGGSYGVERLFHYKMLPEMGPPDTVMYEYPRGDDSWKLEMIEFFEDIRLDRTPVPGLKEAHAVLAVVEKIYAGAKG